MTIKFSEKIKNSVFRKTRLSNKAKNLQKKQVLENTINTSTRILLMY